MYCENCEEYQEPVNGKCPVCGKILIIQIEKFELDEWDNDSEFENID